MHTITLFQGTLPKNHLGNVVVQYQLPFPCRSLQIVLRTKEQDQKTAALLHEKEAEEAFLLHCGRAPKPEERERMLGQMKTEIQLSAFLSGVFMGNIHRPGKEKRMLFSPDAERTCGCMDRKGPYHGLLKLVIQSFGVLEETLVWELEISAGPAEDERKERI